MGLLTKWFSKKNRLEKSSGKSHFCHKNGKDRVGKSKPFFKIGVCQRLQLAPNFYN